MSGNSTLRWNLRSGKSFQAGNREITPVSQALVVGVPHFGFVWNRPVAVRVKDESGTKTIPIVDITRLTQIGLFAATFFFVLWSLASGRMVSKNDQAG